MTDEERELLRSYQRFAVDVAATLDALRDMLQIVAAGQRPLEPKHAAQLLPKVEGSRAATIELRERITAILDRPPVMPTPERVM